MANNCVTVRHCQQILTVTIIITTEDNKSCLELWRHVNFRGPWNKTAAPWGSAAHRLGTAVLDSRVILCAAVHINLQGQNNQKTERLHFSLSERNDGTSLLRDRPLCSGLPCCLETWKSNDSYASCQQVMAQFVSLTVIEVHGNAWQCCDCCSRSVESLDPQNWKPF
jgi:hypothetical protein